MILTRDNPVPPAFSIIIPSYNRPALLKRCVASVQALDYPTDRFEIVIVNDGGEQIDEADYIRADGAPVRVLTQAKAGPAAARNMGAAQARGSILFFTDDDCEIARQTLNLLADCFANSGDVIAGGRTINLLTGNISSVASQCLIDYLYAYYHENATKPFIASNNLAIRRDDFLRIGGFDARFPLAAGEDRYFCACWAEAGGRFMQLSEPLVFHSHALTFATFIKQHFMYGRGAATYHDLARVLDPRHSLEPLTFYLNLLCSPYRSQPPYRAVVVSLLLLTAQVSNALGLLYERLVAGIRS